MEGKLDAFKKPRIANAIGSFDKEDLKKINSNNQNDLIFYLACLGSIQSIAINFNKPSLSSIHTD